MYLTTEIPVTPGGKISVGHSFENKISQQWAFQKGELVNGINQRLSISKRGHVNGNGILSMGSECLLEDSTTDKYYVVPKDLIVHWIDMVALKHAGMPSLLKEVLLYQHMAAFHISTIIGLSPEELVTRAESFQGIIKTTVDKLQQDGKNKAIGDIVSGSLDTASVVLNLLGWAFAGSTLGVSTVLAFLGSMLSLSSSSLTKIRTSAGDGLDEESAEAVLEEIQRSILSGAYALASFLDRYVTLLKEAEAYLQSNAGKKLLDVMEADKLYIAEQSGYHNWGDFIIGENLATLGSFAFWRSAASTLSSFGSSGYALYELAQMHHLTKAEVFTKLSGINLGDTKSFGSMLSKSMMIYTFVSGGIRLTTGIRDLHQHDKLGDVMIEDGKTIQKHITIMYRALNELTGDVEDLRFLEAISNSDELTNKFSFTDDSWRSLEKNGNGNFQSPVYGQTYDVNWRDH